MNNAMKIHTHSFYDIHTRTTLVEGLHATAERLDGRTTTSIKTFKIGDEALYDSCYIYYIGTIVGITAEHVTIKTPEGKRKRLTGKIFGFENHNFDAKEAHRLNAERAHQVVNRKAR